MLTNETTDTLIEFGAKTRAVIVTSKMPELELDRLGTMLMNWKNNPTDQNEKAILDRFAVEQEDDFEEPGNNY